MNKKIAPALPAHLYYGFYNPAKEIPVVSKNHIEPFQDSFHGPLKTVEQAHQFLDAAQYVLPTLQPITQKVQSGLLTLRLTEESPPHIGNFSNNNPILFLPERLPLKDCFPLLVGALATFVPFLFGPASFHPPWDLANTRTSKQFATHVGWHFALGLSFTYQIAHELSFRQIEVDCLSEGNGILTPTDLSLFTIFRQSGLAGLAQHYSRFLQINPNNIKSVEEELILLLSAGHSVEVSPEESTPPFALSKSPLDEWAQEVIRYNQTLYQLNSYTTPISPLERLEIQKALETHMVSRHSLPILMRLIVKMAPILAASLCDPFEQGKIIWTVLKPPSNDDPEVSWDASRAILQAQHLLGLTLDHQYPFEATRGQKAGNVLKDLVWILSMAVMPDHLFKPWSIQSVKTIDEKYRLLRHMERNYIRQLMWGYTGIFEFVHEARSRGFDIQLSDTDIEKKKLLTECGFLVLCERWERFEDPDAVHALRGEIAYLAEKFASEKTNPQPSFSTPSQKLS